MSVPAAFARSAAFFLILNGLMILGITSLPKMHVDVFPEFAPPRVVIQTACVGLSTSDVEQLVTVPLEAGLNGIQGLDDMRSKSVPQLSSIELLFKPGTDLLRARQLVQERIATVSPSLPTWAAPPVMLAPVSATGRAMQIGMTSKDHSLIEMSMTAYWTIRARLLRVPGVANVAIWNERLQLMTVGPKHIVLYALAPTFAAMGSKLLFVLGFGISFWQALIVSVVGIVLSFLACGFISVAGKRGSAPTMVLSRAAFGVNGNKLPAAISWVLTVGWETVLVILATLATATVFKQLGWGGGNGTKVVALIIVVGLTIFGGVMGFDLIMRLQTVITIVTGVATVVFIALVADHIHWHTVSGIHSGSAQAVIGALVFVMTGFGLGWVNVAADYSRYLPRRSSGAGVVWWTTFASSIAPIFLVVFGLLLAGSSSSLNSAIQADPIGALATLLPTWFLVPFAIVAVLGLIGGSVLDIYSSGLALLTLGVRVPRYVAALIDGTVMTLGTIYVVFFAHSNFIVQFQGFLITLGVPIAAWCGIMLADIALRRRDYAEPELFTARGRYGDIIAVSGDPLTDVTVLEKPVFVMKGGAVFKRLGKMRLLPRPYQPVESGGALSAFPIACRVPDREAERQLALEHERVVERIVGLEVGADDGNRSPAAHEAEEPLARGEPGQGRLGRAGRGRAQEH